MKKNPCIDCLVKPCCEEFCPKANTFITKTKKLANIITTILLCTSMVTAQIMAQILIYNKTGEPLMIISVSMFLIGSQTAIFSSMKKIRKFIILILIRR